VPPLGAAYGLVKHPRTETASASAQASHLPAHRLAKAVVLKGADGFLLVVLPASRHIKFGELRELLGRHVDMANEEQIETLFVDCVAQMSRKQAMSFRRLLADAPHGRFTEPA
jgi:Ala-tRNA(Pro) deacylase